MKNLPHKKLVPTLVLLLIICPTFIAQVSSLQLTTTSEYTNHVHTQINTDKGNITQVDKPIFPIMINNSQIQIGESWTITCPLQAEHNYHVYIYGTWVNTSAAAKTDYDIYVYDPAGNMESSHTEAAGFPEHLGSTGDDTIFIPKQTGNYSFVIKNDDRESEGSQQATFMIIENLECNKWYSTSVEGKGANSLPGLRTTWAYEFVTNLSKVEVYLKIPDALDMYEARLYLMNTDNSPNINGFPLPWEEGLYGTVSGAMGGYNFESEGYRGVTYASCEYKGQDMSLSYTSLNAGNNLYHLEIIGEEGAGEVEFLMKTTFDTITLTPAVALPSKIYPGDPTTLSFLTNSANLKQANLSYTVDNWATTHIISMDVSNKTCNATIPSQAAGTTVQYQVDAQDVLENPIVTTGSYAVKAQPTLDITLGKETITLGQNITFTGTLTPCDNQSIVNFQFFTANASETISCRVLENGTFTANYEPTASGTWAVAAIALETPTLWAYSSSQFIVTVNEPPLYVKYSLYIIIGLVVALAVGGVVYWLKTRNG